MSLSDVDITWTFLVPLKDRRSAKSRLRMAPSLTAELARVMAHDTVSSLCDTRGVAAVVMVCDRYDDVAELAAWPRVRTWIDHTRSGLNDALAGAAALVRKERPDAWLAVCPADLPALDAVELADVLDRCAGHPRCVVGDRAGSGTTLLTARGGVDLDPRYGPDSLAAHRASGAAVVDVAIDAPLRHDVDVPGDLDWLVRAAPQTRSAALLSRQAVLS